MDCYICCILSSVSIGYCLSSCSVCNSCSSCSCRGACSRCRSYFNVYKLIVCYISFLVCKVFNKSKLSCSVKGLCTWCRCSRRCIKLCTSAYLVVVNYDVSCILSSVLIDYCLRCISMCKSCCSCCTWGCCTCSTTYIHSYKLIVIYIRFLVCKVLCKSQLSATVYCLRSRSRCSCRCVKFCCCSVNVVMYCNICRIFSLVVIVYYLIACYICNCSCSACIRCACTACSCYIRTYILVVGDICRLIC